MLNELPRHGDGIQVKANNEWRWVERRRAFSLALLAVLITTPLAFLAHFLLPHANLSLLFLTAVLITASRAGMEAALYAGLLGFFSFNFFFTRPYYTLFVLDHGDLATLGFFLIMAAISGKLAARMQSEIEQNRAMVQRLTNINHFTRMMAAAPDSETVGSDLARHIASTFHAPAWVVVNENGDESRIYGHDGTRPLPPLAHEVLAELQAMDSDGVFHSWYCFRVSTGQGSIGQVILQTPDLNQASQELARILCDLAAVTLERARLVAELEQARVVSETEQLRSALLSSVSHDLRTPLAAIIGSTSSLLEYGGSISESDRKELMRTVLQEAERLNRYIQNLLDMTRLGGGKITLKRDWVDLSDIVSSAVDRLRNALAPFRLDIDIPSDMPLLYVHGVLIEQALVNVLDNAAGFSPAGGVITIQAGGDDDNIMLKVCDEGPGIPPSARESVFDMFYTVSEGDRKHQGTGLGLAICRGLVETHGGSVIALGGKDGSGTCIHITLPHYEPGKKEEANSAG
jgi:two-component system sensor histidine kinase KdpD